MKQWKKHFILKTISDETSLNSLGLGACGAIILLWFKNVKMINLTDKHAYVFIFTFIHLYNPVLLKDSLFVVFALSYLSLSLSVCLYVSACIHVGAGGEFLKEWSYLLVNIS